MKIKNDSADAGYTMVEIMVSVTLLAGMAVMVFSAFANTSKMSKVDVSSGPKYNIARGVLESLHESVRKNNDAGADQWGAAGKPLSTSSTPALSTTTLDGVTYNPRYTVETVDVDNDQKEDYRRVTVTVP